MTHEELFEAFYNVVAKETGKECIKFFNEQLEKAKNNEEDLQFLLLAIRKYRSRNMIYEERWSKRAASPWSSSRSKPLLNSATS